ncbi:MAG: TIGR04076 family protein [Bacillota bacterium]|jgi:uncharacterized repeat protein (TIGR04076 family)
MKRWYPEEFSFQITVVSLRPDNQPENYCRNGHEVGDEYRCAYECPAGFCSKSMLKLFPLLEAVRSGGDLRNLGGSGRYIMEFDCPDGVVRFRLQASRISPDGPSSADKTRER